LQEGGNRSYPKEHTQVCDLGCAVQPTHLQLAVKPCAISHSTRLITLNNSSCKKAAIGAIPRSIHKYVTWVAQCSQHTCSLKYDE